MKKNKKQWYGIAAAMCFLFLAMTIVPDVYAKQTKSALSSEYTVSFYVDDGTCSQKSIMVTYGEAYGTLPDAVKTGYDFAGWYTQKTGGEKVTESTIVTNTQPHILYAHWTKKKFVISFDADGGKVSPAQKQVTYGEMYGTLPVPVKTDYKFLGWCDNASQLVKASSVVTKFGNHTLTALWEYVAPSYPITFNANGGYCAESMRLVYYNSAYGTLPTVKRDGYLFDGWYKKTNGTLKKISAGMKLTEKKAQIFYAKWIPQKVTLSAEVKSANSISLKWKKADASAKGYILYRCLTKNGKYQKIKTISSVKTTSYTDKNLAEGTYYYKIAVYGSFYIKEAKVKAETVTGKLSKVASKKIKGKLMRPELTFSFNEKKQQAVFQWKKIKNADKIIVYRKIKKGKFKQWKVLSNKKTSVTIPIKQIKKQGKTFIKVKAYYKVGKVTVYSKESTIRSVE